jgi:hypothetical protein
MGQLFTESISKSAQPTCTPRSVQSTQHQRPSLRLLKKDSHPGSLRKPQHLSSKPGILRPLSEADFSVNKPDLGVLENPWIEDATMEWSNHAIALRASAEVVTHSLDNPREGEGAPDVQVGVERCDVGAIGAVGLLRDLDGPERDSVVCEVLPLVPHFEGEENYRYEMTNLPVAEGPLAPKDLPDYALKLLRENVPESPLSVEAVSVWFRQGFRKFVCRKRTICSLGGIR